MIRLAVSSKEGRGDADAIFALLHELGYTELARDAFSRAFGAVLGHADMKVWVAEEDAVIVGMISLSRRPQMRLGGAIATIDELVIASAWRGKGIGADLLATAKNEAVRIGAVRLQLETNRSRDAYKRAFYPKNGFVEVDRAVMRIENPQLPR